MKFAHLADCHIGAWREPKLAELSMKSFREAIDRCIKKNVDFILISGDLFNTSLPSLDKLKDVVKILMELRKKEIPVYLIAGSHDFSPSGKTMLDVLEGAELLVNVVRGKEEDGKLRLKFAVDKKTGAKITGLLGRRGTLEKSYYESLDRQALEDEDGFKIFMLHSGITEFMPSEMGKVESIPLSLLPKTFDYYAAGHIHYVFQRDENKYGIIAYPGPLFPNNFSELEELHHGGFYIYDNGKLHHEELPLAHVMNIKKNCGNKSAEVVNKELLEEISEKDAEGKIVTIDLYGCLESGKTTGIDFKTIFDKLYGKKAYFVMKNTSRLTTKEFESIKVSQGTVEEIEEMMISEHLGQIKVEGIDSHKERALIKHLMNVLNAEKQEGETRYDFEERLKKGVEGIYDDNS
ncbi:DNA repair exonuclease [Candidatus Woesearchaeota archaeon]|nr:DNA repair exonuclease [Candidatus Woesearchaeota archaeon]